jgi:hypothetical protein
LVSFPNILTLSSVSAVPRKSKISPEARPAWRIHCRWTEPLRVLCGCLWGKYQDSLTDGAVERALGNSGECGGRMIRRTRLTAGIHELSKGGGPVARQGERTTSTNTSVVCPQCGHFSGGADGGGAEDGGDAPNCCRASAMRVARSRLASSP